MFILLKDYQTPVKKKKKKVEKVVQLQSSLFVIPQQTAVEMITK